MSVTPPIAEHRPEPSPPGERGSPIEEIAVAKRASLPRKLWTGATNAKFWQAVGGIAAVAAVVIPVANSCSQDTPASPPVSSSVVQVAPADPASKYWGSAIASGTDWWGLKFADWTDAPLDRADLGLHTRLGASALHGVVLARVADPGFPSCWNAKYDITRLMLDEISSGTTLCVKTQTERVGTVRFTWTRESDGYPRSIEVTGVIWEPRK